MWLIQKLPGTFVLRYAPACWRPNAPPTRGQYDISYLRAVPNFTGMAPKDEAELQRMLVTSIHQQQTAPARCAFPAGKAKGVPLAEEAGSRLR